MYTPDPSGRRANEAIQLQHASPFERPTTRERDRFNRPLEAAPSYSSHPFQPVSTTLGHQTSMTNGSPSQSRGAATNVRERPEFRMPSDYTSSEDGNGDDRHPHTPRTRTILWYCCHGPGRGHGPYNVDIYKSCLNCDHRMCVYCQQEAIIVRDRAVSRR